MKPLEGSIVALITPFKNQKVDYKALAKLVNFHIKSGTNGIVPCGTTGESPTLSHDEHKNVIAATVDAAGGRVPVIAGTGSNSTDEAVQLTKFAKKCGADASLSVVPYYNKPTQKGLYDHFSMIAKKSSLPIVLYNIPGRCSVGLQPKTIVDLSKISNIVAIKEATGIMDMTSEVISKTKLAVLSGDDSLTLPLMTLGAKGVISVLANIFPTDSAELIQRFNENDIDEARKIHLRMYSLCKALFVETNPIPIKAAMKILKLDSGEVRLPLSTISTENRLILSKAIKNYQKAR